MIARARQIVEAVLATPARADAVVFWLIAVSWTLEFLGRRPELIGDLSPSRRHLWFALTLAIVLVMLLRSRLPVATFAIVAFLMVLLITLVGSESRGFTSEWALYVCTYTIALAAPAGLGGRCL